MSSSGRAERRRRGRVSLSSREIVRTGFIEHHRPAHHVEVPIDVDGGAPIIFELDGLEPEAFVELLDAHQPLNDRRAWNPATFPPALVAACCTDPVMTQAEVFALFIELGAERLTEVFDGALRACGAKFTVVDGGAVA